MKADVNTATVDYRVYLAYVSMKQRCGNAKTQNYRYCGGRGIKICKRWLDSFENFYADMGPKPSPSHVLRRLNRKGDYEPRNCCWSELPKNTRHGKSNTREYRIYYAMLQRCRNPNHKSYERYGGRGIKICKRWLDSFENFYADMGARPGPRHTIERLDRNGNYTPKNCCWSTYREQNFNTSRNHLLTFHGKTMAVTLWAKFLNVAPHILRGRLHAGWSVEDVLTRPVQPWQRLITYKGRTMNARDWAKTIGVAPWIIEWRLRKGWSIEDALTKPVRPKSPRHITL